LNFQNKVLYY